MPKVKTHKGTHKRFKKTKTGKLLHRTSGQDHYNSRESSKVTMNKRRDSSMSKQSDNIRSLIPYKQK
jgi:large subunit ribosomal protein L35